MLDTFGLVVAAFSVTDKVNQIKFFEETFMVANISPKVVLGMPFVTLSNVDVDFLDQKPRRGIYTTEKALPTTRYVELIDKKEFTAATLDPENETFVVHVASLNSIASPKSSLLNFHPFHRSQIAGLIDKKASTKVLKKYVDFVNILSLDLTSELSEHIGINDYAIELIIN